MMQRKIMLRPDDVKAFVNAATKCSFDIDVSYNRFVVDAKSILIFKIQKAAGPEAPPSRMRCIYFASSFSSAERRRLRHSTSIAFSSSATGGRLGAMRRLESSGSLR